MRVVRIDSVTILVVTTLPLFIDYTDTANRLFMILQIEMFDRVENSGAIKRIL
jgi:hypothetical protein